MKKPNEEIPAGATAGQIAKILGVTERIIAGRKSDGRLPVLPGGRVDLHALVKLGAVEAARQRGAAQADDGPTPAERYDAGLRMAASTTAHLVLAAVQAPRPGEDAEEAAARALGEALGLFGLAAA